MSEFLVQPKLSDLHEVIELFIYFNGNLLQSMSNSQASMVLSLFSVFIQLYISVLFFVIFLLVTDAAISVRDTLQFEIVDVGVLYRDTMWACR